MLLLYSFENVISVIKFYNKQNYEKLAYIWSVKKQYLLKNYFIYILYLHWDAFAPVSWKRGTLRTLVNRAYLVCSNKELLHNKLAYLRSVFLEKYGYPLTTIKQLMKEIEENQKQKEVTQISMMEQPNPQEQKVHSLLLSFVSSKSTAIVKNLNKTLKSVLPNNVKHALHTQVKN